MGDVTIEDANTEVANQHIGGVVFVSILILVGFIGNLHVLIVYSLFMKPSNHRTFILMLGTVDFIASSIGMPFIIIDLRNPLTFTLTYACKLLRFLNYFNASASSATLTIIATDRYRKICVPFGKQITQRVAVMLCFVAAFIGLMLSWPAPFLYGIAHVKTETNLTGTRCWTEDKPNYDRLLSLFNAGLMLVVSVTFIALVVIYSMIARVISKRVSFKSKESKSKTVSTASVSESRGNSDLSSDVTESSAHKSINEKAQEKRQDNCRKGNDSTCEPNGEKYEISIIDKHPKAKTERETDRRKKDDRSKNDHQSKRTTLMFFLITMVYIGSYIPHFTLKIVNFMDKDFFPNLSYTNKIIFNTSIWCFFINNVINCFVYSFFDPRFRQELQQMYRKVALWK